MISRKFLTIAIAAVSGGGKTFITTELHNHIENSKVLCFDDYDSDGPENICEWVENGSDYNEWNLKSLTNEIDKIINDKDNKVELLILDYPFAKKHDIMNNYIDYTIFIDTPLDISLSRRILRDFKDQSKSDIQNELYDYVTNQRVAYLDMLKKIKPNSDLIIDGALEKDIIIKRIMEELLKVKSETLLNDEIKMKGFKDE